MSFRDFRKAGHPPTLLSAFLYFDVSFMVWVILGPLGPFIGEAYHLDAAQKGLLTAVPLLGGSFFRLILGWMTERLGGRRTGLIGLSVSLIPLLIAWQFANSFPAFLALGILLGVAGASFAAALPLASGWYPPEHQGLAMGIAGAGNSGTLFATLFAPRLAQAFGWRSVFGFAMIPVAVVWVVFFFLAKDAPGEREVKRWSDYSSLLKISDTGWFCFIYSLTFGGFVGLASYLPIFFHDQYHLTRVQAGDFTTFVILFGSFLRPIGGVLADRVGGHRMLVVLLAGASLCLGAVGTLPPAWVTLLFLAAGHGNAGNGQWFRVSVIAATISRSRRHHDRNCRSSGRIRRLLAAFSSGCGEAANRQFWSGICDCCCPDAHRLSGIGVPQEYLAPDMECPSCYTSRVDNWHCCRCCGSGCHHSLTAL